MSASWEVQVALYNALIGDTTFMNLIGNKIYDDPPTDTDYPYVCVGSMTEIPEDRHSALGYQVTMSMTIYTKPQGLGFYPAEQILTSMNRILNMKKFSLSNYTMIICKLDSARNDKMDDIRMIDVRYRVICH
jgi:hypothetical protein